MKRLLKVLRNTILILGIFYVALFIFTRIIHYPDPIASIKLGLAPASKTPTLMPWHVIDPASTPTAIPVTAEKMPDEIMYKGTKESDKFVDYFPDLKNGSSFDLVTIKQLLDMQAGVGVSDNYPSGPSGWGVAIAQMYATTDLDWFLKNNRKMAFEPGTKSEYRSVDTQMLGMIIKKVTGKKVADYFSKNVWQVVGAKYPATWNVDRVGGTEKTFCCFNASGIDYARVGMLFLNGGYAGPNKVIDKIWLKRMTTPVTTLDRDWGYAAQVWHPYPNTYLALGLHGQFIFINPDTRTVIVKLSDNPTDSDHESDTAKALLEISNLKN